MGALMDAVYFIKEKKGELGEKYFMITMPLASSTIGQISDPFGGKSETHILYWILCSATKGVVLGDQSWPSNSFVVQFCFF